MTILAAAGTSHASFRRTFGSELLKLVTLPALRSLAVAVVGLGALGGVMFGSSGADAAVLGASTLAATGFALLAGLSIAGEYATGSIRTTLTAVPRRSTLFLAKSLTLVTVGMVLGFLAGTLGAAAIGGLDTVVLPRIIGCAAYVASAGLVGFFLGTLVRTVAATAVTIIIVVFLLPPLTGGIRIGGGYVSDFLLGESGGALVMGTTDWWTPFVTVVVWLGVLGVAAAARLRSGDA